MASKVWDAKDEICPYCGQVTKKAKGINKQNLKKLCFSKPSIQDIVIFIMLVLCLTLTWAYYNETSQYKKMYENPEEFCNSYWRNVPIGNNYPSNIELNQFENSRNG